MPDPETPEGLDALAQLAYAAYTDYTGGLNYLGLPCPPWGELGERIRGAWRAASDAVRMAESLRKTGE